ncbi:hypothetical protein HY994_03435 [Candidatus Micrarchaeota archaeon]|nr:hypothetical protein [Candidatus Micrarchaeota archaeon]
MTEFPKSMDPIQLRLRCNTQLQRYSVSLSIPSDYLTRDRPESHWKCILLDAIVHTKLDRKAFDTLDPIRQKQTLDLLKEQLAETTSSGRFGGTAHGCRILVELQEHQMQLDKPTETVLDEIVHHLQTKSRPGDSIRTQILPS